MRCLFAALADSNNVIINRGKIVSTIYEFKNSSDPNLADVFGRIEFRENIDSVLSSDIEEGINTLQTFGVVGKLNQAIKRLLYF